MELFGPVSRIPDMFSHPKSRGKISNLMMTELFYSLILEINRGSLNKIKGFRCRYTSLRYSTLIKNGFAGATSFRGFRETGPWC